MQQIKLERIGEEAWVGWKFDPLGSYSEYAGKYVLFEYVQSRICFEDKMHKLLWRFEIQTDDTVQVRRQESKKMDNIWFWQEVVEQDVSSFASC